MLKWTGVEILNLTVAEVVITCTIGENCLAIGVGRHAPSLVENEQAAFTADGQVPTYNVPSICLEAKVDDNACQGKQYRTFGTHCRRSEKCVCGCFVM
jgi:flavoprotein